tara:strand:- start:67 stop:1248 length:1182 start_codon:yes stop_codon:yes gene_type:complete
MINEHDVATALRLLPDSSWLRNYCRYASNQTTAPLAYHLGTGLALLSSTVPLDGKMRYAGDLCCTQYSMLVGRSGEDQKSTAMKIGKEIMFDAAPTTFGNRPGSFEGLIDGLANQPQQLLMYYEMGVLLASTTGGYLEALKALYTDLWDGTPQQRAKANDNLIKVDQPRVSIIGACAVPYLENYTKPHDWTGGFLGRWMIFYAQRERTDPDPIGNTQGRSYLVEDLRQLAEGDDFGHCAGLSQHAYQMWSDWFFDLDSRPIPSLIAGIRSRVPTMVRKICLILAWEQALAFGKRSWEIDETLLSAAIAFGELHLKSILGLATRIDPHHDARLRRQVLQCLPNIGDTTSLADILRTTKFRRSTIMETLETLLIEETIDQFIHGNHKISYTRLLR